MTSLPQGQSLDILAIAAHRDDVEQTCGGTLLKAAQRGQTNGHSRSHSRRNGHARHGRRSRARGERRREDSRRAWRRALDIPDGRVENTWENRLKVASVIRETRPRVVILPYWKGRHPDHYTASILGYEACFLAGLAKLGTTGQGLGSQYAAHMQISALPPHRPFKIIYATLYYDIRPTFVVDISDQFEEKFASILAYKSQFGDQEAGKDHLPCPSGDPRPRGRHGPLLRHAWGRDLRRALPAKRSRPGRRPLGDSGQIHLAWLNSISERKAINYASFRIRSHGCSGDGGCRGSAGWYLADRSQSFRGAVLGAAPRRINRARSFHEGDRLSANTIRRTPPRILRR